MSTTGWIGKPVKRVEDARLLTGRGTYIDDHPPVANLHHAAIVRSPHAHARILGYDLEAARAVEGVVGAIARGDIPGISCVVIDGEVRVGRSRNTPLAKRLAGVTGAAVAGAGH